MILAQILALLPVKVGERLKESELERRLERHLEPSRFLASPHSCFHLPQARRSLESRRGPLAGARFQGQTALRKLERARG